MNPTLTSSTPLSTNSSPSSIPTVDIKKVIEESKSSIESQEKRKRGRPRKIDVSPSPHVSPTQAAPSLPPPPSAIPPEVLAPAIQFPFALLAAKTGYDDFALDSATAESLAPSLDQVLRQYLPATAASPHAALITFGFSLLTIAGVKTLGYMQWKREQEKPAKSPGKQAYEPARAENQMVVQ